MFDPATLGILRDAREVRIRAGRTVGRGTVIWIVLVDDAAFVRSYHGPTGHWFVAASATGRATLLTGPQEISVRVTPITEAATLAEVGAAFQRKYANSPYLPAMLSEAAATTTLRLDPA